MAPRKRGRGTSWHRTIPDRRATPRRPGRTPQTSSSTSPASRAQPTRRARRSSGNPASAGASSATSRRASAGPRSRRRGPRARLRPCAKRTGFARRGHAGATRSRATTTIPARTMRATPHAGASSRTTRTLATTGTSARRTTPARRGDVSGPPCAGASPMPTAGPTRTGTFATGRSGARTRPASWTRRPWCTANNRPGRSAWSRRASRRPGRARRRPRPTAPRATMGTPARRTTGA